MMKVGKVISTNLSRNSGIPKYEKEFIEIYKFGVKGDYHSGKVNFHANKNNLGRQISIVSNEVLKEINGLIGKKLFPGSLGENILIEGFGYLENFNKGDNTSGTNLYSLVKEKNDEFPEHYRPWRPKEDFKILKTLEPEYNRLVFFDGLKFLHGANFPDDRYFGEEYRTNQVFFFLGDDEDDEDD